MQIIIEPNNFIMLVIGRVIRKYLAIKHDPYFMRNFIIRNASSL